jgi:Transposase DDE domain
MANRTKESVSRQLQQECKALQSSSGLPFSELLSEETIRSALDEAGIKFRERIFTPAVTFWAFLSQSIAGEDTSCQDAVSRVLVDRVARGKRPCSTDNNSYCQARQRLPEMAIANLTRQTGQQLHRDAQEDWLWHRRRVTIVDGSTATMPDTPENQAEFPQGKSQKPGLGFPILRFVLLLSLSVGTVLECALGPCRGKRSGEQNLFRQTWSAFRPGDVVLADRLYDNYRDVALLKRDGIDVVFGKNRSRQCDFRRGRRLGKDDHVVTWHKPQYHASRFESRQEWESLPETIEMREVRLVVRRKGYRTRTVVVVTTLLDGEEYSRRELTDLFALRWHCELDIRSIKVALGMHHLRCKTPEMVRKELWMHLLAYNLIRVRMAQAAAVSGCLPRELSFTDAKRHIENFAPYLSTTQGSEHARIERALIDAIASGRLSNRPGRKEPRAIKKRNQKYPYLTKPRAEARKRLPA